MGEAGPLDVLVSFRTVARRLPCSLHLGCEVGLSSYSWKSNCGPLVPLVPTSYWVKGRNLASVSDY